MLSSNHGGYLQLFYSGDFVSTIEVQGKKILSIQPEALTLLAENAFIDIAHLLRPAHLQVSG
jgi:fumarate hydratase, class I